MKKALTTSLLLISICASYGQVNKIDDLKSSLLTENKDTVAWVHGGSINIGMNEGFLHNWPAGGEIASLTVNGVASAFLTHFDHKNIWSNNITLAYGLTYANSNNFVPRKTDDRIDFTSKYGTLVPKSTDFYFTGLFNLKTQSTKGYNYTLTNWQNAPTSNLFSPAYLTLAAGMEYRKGTNITLFLSPIAAREILVDKYYTTQTPDGAFGVRYGKTSKFGVGAYFSGRYVWNINKNANFRTRLDLYENYLAKDTKDSTGKIVTRDNPGNIQILWDNMFTWKPTKYLGIAIGTTFVYDNNVPYIKVPANTNTPPGNDIGWLQISQVFTFGLIYTFH